MDVDNTLRDLETKEAILEKKLTTAATTLALLLRFWNLHKSHTTPQKETACMNFMAALTRQVDSLKNQLSALRNGEIEPLKQQMEQLQQDTDVARQTTEAREYEMEAMRQDYETERHNGIELDLEAACLMGRIDEILGIPGLVIEGDMAAEIERFRSNYG